jgi:hypothetical protein
MHTKSHLLGRYILSLLLFVFIVLTVCFSFFSLSNLRAQSQVAVTGFVSGPMGVKISGVKVGIYQSSAISDDSGKYTLTNVSSGWNKMYVQALGYETVEQDIFVPFGTAIEQNISLSNLNYATIKGRISSFDTQLNFQNASLTVNTTPVLIDDKGVFFTDKLDIQKVSLLLKVVGYEDYYSTIDLQNGPNDIGEIKLIPSKEPTKLLLKSQIRNLPLYNTTITLNDTLVQTDDYGMLSLKGYVNDDLLKIDVKGYEKKSIFVDSSKPILEVSLDTLNIENNIFIK